MVIRQNQSSCQNALEFKDQWSCLIVHAAFINEIDEQPTKVLLKMHKWRSSRSGKQNIDLNHDVRLLQPLNAFSDLSPFIKLEYLAQRD